MARSVPPGTVGGRVLSCCCFLRLTPARPWTPPWRAWPARSPRSSPPSPSSLASWSRRRSRGRWPGTERPSRSAVRHAYCHCWQPLPPLRRPSALDSFSALSGQVSTLTKQLRVDRTSSMQNYVFLPLQLSNEHDPQLEVCLCVCGGGGGRRCMVTLPHCRKPLTGD